MTTSNLMNHFRVMVYNGAPAFSSVKENKKEKDNRTEEEKTADVMGQMLSFMVLHLFHVQLFKKRKHLPHHISSFFLFSSIIFFFLVRSGHKTWQQFYEEWYLLGEEDPIWATYRPDGAPAHISSFFLFSSIIFFFFIFFYRRKRRRSIRSISCPCYIHRFNSLKNL
jgi:hypothetical protein